MSRESTATWRLLSKYYVYAHRVICTGEIFYIGKGKGRRGWAKSKRNNIWNNITKKYEYEVVILWHGDNEFCALSIEKVYIAKYRSLGFARANISDGGTGASGAVRSMDERVELSRARGGRPVYCSNGMYFDSCAMAGDYFGINRSNIKKCADGIITSSGGYSWSYDGVPDLNITLYKIPSPRSKVIYSSELEEFKSITDAASYLSSIGIKAERSPIRLSANSEYLTAYGRRWSFNGFPEKPEYAGNEAKGKWQSDPERNAIALERRKINASKNQIPSP